MVFIASGKMRRLFKRSMMARATPFLPHLAGESCLDPLVLRSVLASGNSALSRGPLAVACAPGPLETSLWGRFCRAVVLGTLSESEGPCLPETSHFQLAHLEDLISESSSLLLSFGGTDFYRYASGVIGALRDLVAKTKVVVKVKEV